MLENGFLRCHWASDTVASNDAAVFGIVQGCLRSAEVWSQVGLGMVPHFFARCGAACQTGEARALAAALRRRAAVLHVAAAGQPDAIAIFMRRTLIRTSAPIFNSLRRMVPQLALVNGVWWSPIRRTAHSST